MNNKAIHIINKCTPELSFTTSRSSGSGGQHVNKVETRVTLRWDISGSVHLTAEEKTLLLNKLSSQINTSGEFSLSSEISRSQLKNKQEAIKKWQQLIIEATKVVKPRKATRPPKSAIDNRLKSKARRSQVKELRKKPSL